MLLQKRCFSEVVNMLSILKSKSYSSFLFHLKNLDKLKLQLLLNNIRVNIFNGCITKIPLCYFICIVCLRLSIKRQAAMCILVFISEHLQV